MIVAALLAAAIDGPHGAPRAKARTGGGRGVASAVARFTAGEGHRVLAEDSHAASPDFEGNARESIEQRAIDALVRRGTKEERTRELIAALEDGNASQPQESARSMRRRKAQ